MDMPDGLMHTLPLNCDELHEHGANIANLRMVSTLGFEWS